MPLSVEIPTDIIALDRCGHNDYIGSGFGQRIAERREFFRPLWRYSKDDATFDEPQIVPHGRLFTRDDNDWLQVPREGFLWPVPIELRRKRGITELEKDACRA